MISAAVAQLDPGADNPRNSEGSFVALRNDRLLFAFSRFTGGGGDNDSADIAVIESADAGRTWSAPRVLVPNPGNMNAMSVSFLRLADGRIALFYLVKEWRHGVTECRPWMRTSADEGATWSDPTLCIPAPGYFVVNNDRIVQLTSGRIVIPATLHRMKRENDRTWAAFDGRSIAMCFLSDDAGATWRESADWWALPMRSSSGLQEMGVVELADRHRTLFGWCRTSTGYQWGMTSRDGGDTWIPPEPTEFIGPCAPLSIRRIPSTGHLLAVWNDTSGRFALAPPAKESWGRTPLVSAISDDEGKTWARHRLIEDDPERGYCYTAIAFVADAEGPAVLLAYCAGGKPTGSVLNTLRIRRVGLPWFYGEEQGR